MTNKTLKAILINPYDMTVSEVQVSKGIEAIYAQLGCDLVDAARIDRQGTSIYVDDEGLLKDREDIKLFQFHDSEGARGQRTGTVHTLAGKGLVLGLDDEGNSVDCPYSVAQIEACIFFLGEPSPLELEELTKWEVTAF